LLNTLIVKKIENH